MMNISDLVDKLLEAKQNHGDLPVWIDDTDGFWYAVEDDGVIIEKDADDETILLLG